MQLTTSFVLLALVALRSVGAAPTPFARSTSEIIDARDLPELQTREYSQVAFHVARDLNDWEDLDARADPPATPVTPVNPAVPAVPAPVNGQITPPTATPPVQSAIVNGKPALPPLSIPGANQLNTPPATPNSANAPPTSFPVNGAQQAPLSPLTPPTGGMPGAAGMYPSPYGRFHHHHRHGMQPYYGHGYGYGRRQRHRDERMMNHLENEHHHDLEALKKLEAENAALKTASSKTPATPTTPPHKLTKKEKKALAKQKHDDAKVKRKAKHEAEKQAREEKHKAKKEKKAAKKKAKQEKKEADKKAKQDKKKAERKADHEQKAAIKEAKKKYTDAKQQLHDLKHPHPSSDKTKKTSTTTNPNTKQTTSPSAKPAAPATQPSSPLSSTKPKPAGVVGAAVVPPVANAKDKSATSPPASALPNGAAAPKPNTLPAQSGASPSTPAGTATPPQSPLSQQPGYGHFDRSWGRHHHFDESQFAASEGMLRQERYGRRHYRGVY